MEFKKGNKVKCIVNKQYKHYLDLNKIYKVVKIHPIFGVLHLKLEDEAYEYDATRFILSDSEIRKQKIESINNICLK